MTELLMTVGALVPVLSLLYREVKVAKRLDVWEAEHAAENLL